MLSRRTFAACALCAASGFLATGANAQTPGFKRTLLKQTDGPVDGYTTIEMRVEIDPNATVPRHTHPGIETGYVAEGGIELTIDGQGTFKLGPGDGFQVPTGTPHGGPNGPAKTVAQSRTRTPLRGPSSATASLPFPLGGTSFPPIVAQSAT